MVDLDRFLWAQEGIIDRALAELAVGRKRSHWMWFVFPQAAGLGHSATAQRYAIHSLPEARAYLAHPLLNRRLRDGCQQLLSHRKIPPEKILGVVDALKLRSSMTLFDAVCSGDIFEEVLASFFAGERDTLTLAIIDGWRQRDIKE